jgi:hypothetical protein
LGSAGGFGSAAGLGAGDGSGFASAIGLGEGGVASAFGFGVAGAGFASAIGFGSGLVSAAGFGAGLASAAGFGAGFGAVTAATSVSGFTTSSTIRGGSERIISRTRRFASRRAMLARAWVPASTFTPRTSPLARTERTLEVASIVMRRSVPERSTRYPALPSSSKTMRVNFGCTPTRTSLICAASAGTALHSAAAAASAAKRRERRTGEGIGRAYSRPGQSPGAAQRIGNAPAALDRNRGAYPTAGARVPRAAP